MSGRVVPFNVLSHVEVYEADEDPEGAPWEATGVSDGRTWHLQSRTPDKDSDVVLVTPDGTLVVLRGRRGAIDPNYAATTDGERKPTRRERIIAEELLRAIARQMTRENPRDSAVSMVDWWMPR